MDYTSWPLGKRISKVARYVRLYGIRLTVKKVESQYHFKRRFSELPELRYFRGGHVGIIGCGNFSFSTIAHYLSTEYGQVIRGVMDIDIHRAASLYERYKAAYYTDDANSIITDPSIDLIYIASNHASHAEYAIEALRRGKCVHIEKPHVVSLDQLRRLGRAMRDSPGRVEIGFNRPRSEIGRRIKQALATGEGPSMLNWFLAGHAIEPSHWYFAKAEGGRVLGNLCHWTDFVLELVQPQSRYPIIIRPTRSRVSDSDVAFTYEFGDGSIAAITFSAKGHTFEGVRERFAAQRGNVLIAMDDFQDLTVEVMERKTRYRSIFRDHGHRSTILNSYAMTTKGGGRARGRTIRNIWETGELFLRTKESLEGNRVITVLPFDEERLSD